MEVVSATVVERVTRPTRENLLRDFVRYSWKATRGLTTVAEAEGEDLIRRMVETGRVSSEQGERLQATLISRMRHSRDRFEGRVEASVRTAVERLADISMRELKGLSQQVDLLERRMERLQTRSRGK